MASAKLRPYDKLPSPLVSVFLLMFFMLFKRHFPNLTSLLVLLIQDKYGISPYFGSKGGAVVRAFASHQCGQGSNHVLRRRTPCVGWLCCWFSPLLREFFVWEWMTKTHFVVVLPLKWYFVCLYIYLLILSVYSLPWWSAW